MWDQKLRTWPRSVQANEKQSLETYMLQNISCRQTLHKKNNKLDKIKRSSTRRAILQISVSLTVYTLI